MQAAPSASHLRSRAFARHGVMLVTAVAALLLAGCGGGDDGAGTTPAAPGSGTGGTPATAYGSNPYGTGLPGSPLSLDLELDGARAATQTITPEAGGTLRVTAADGSVHELTVPADAVAAPIAVTMTPVSRFTRLPFQGAESAAAWGVELEPSGTRFLKPLRLRITPPAGATLPPAQQLAFGWHEGGQRVQLALRDTASTAIDLQLLHFSGYAIGRFEQGVNAALQGLRDRLGAQPGERLETVAAERAAAKWTEARTGERDAFRISDADFRNYLQAYRDEFVKPRVEASGGCANSRVAFETVLNVEMTLKAMNEAPLFAELFQPMNADELMLQLSYACLQLEATRCRTGRVLTDIITAAQGLDAEARRVVDDPWAPQWRRWRAAAEEQVAACHRYRLEVNSEAASDEPGPAGWRFRESVAGSVELRLSGPVLEFSDPIGPKRFDIVGAGELPSTGYSMSLADPCTTVTDVQRRALPFLVQRLAFQRDGSGGLGGLRLEFFPGMNGSDFLQIDSCSLPPTQTRIALFNWSNVFFASAGTDPRYFFADAAAGTGGFYLDQWIVTLAPSTASEVLAARGRIDAPRLDGSTSYQTGMDLRLYHQPLLVPLAP